MAYLPADYPLPLYRGDSFRVQFALWADSAKTDPVDLTGVTVAAEIRTRPAPAGASSTPLAVLACTVAAHVITVTVTAAQSRPLPETAYWDLQLTYPAGDVRTIVAGVVHVRGDVTESTVAAGEITHVGGAMAPALGGRDAGRPGGDAIGGR